MRGDGEDAKPDLLRWELELILFGVAFGEFLKARLFVKSDIGKQLFTEFFDAFCVVVEFEKEKSGGFVVGRKREKSVGVEIELFGDGLASLFVVDGRG